MNANAVYVGVILPDGRIDSSYAAPDDVELVPIREVPQEIQEAVEDGCKTPDQLDLYLRCRANGCNRKLAICLAMKSFPGVKSDAIFNEGKFSGESGRIGVQELWRREQAEKVGVSTNGKWYCSGLADFPGDPTAWVGDRGDVLRVARKKNMTVHGYVESQGHESDPGEDLPIAQEIIDREVDSFMEMSPGANREAVADSIYQLRTGQVDNSPLRVEDRDSDHDFD